jgi:hypothetical protein
MRAKREEQKQTATQRISTEDAAQLALMKARVEAGVAQRTGGLGYEPLLAPLVKSAETVKGLPAATQALTEARAQLAKGMFTGAGANQKLAIAKSKEALGNLLGVDMTDPRIQNTETFKSTIMPLVAQARSATSGNANISDADINLALSAAGGNIALDEKTFPRVLDALERVNLGLAIGHQQRVSGAAAGNEQAATALQAVYGIPPEQLRQMIPPHLVQRLRDNPNTAAEFDQYFRTPGLARHILGK